LPPVLITAMHSILISGPAPNLHFFGGGAESTSLFLPPPPHFPGRQKPVAPLDGASSDHASPPGSDLYCSGKACPGRREGGAAVRMPTPRGRHLFVSGLRARRSAAAAHAPNVIRYNHVRSNRRQISSARRRGRAGTAQDLTSHAPRAAAFAARTSASSWMPAPPFSDPNPSPDHTP